MADIVTTLDNRIAHWRLESGALTVDEEGTYTLTDNNATGTAAGKQGNGADFTPNDNLSIAEQAAFRYTSSNNLSCSFWFKADALGGVMGLVGMYNGTSDVEEWLVYLNGTSLVLLVRNQGAAVTYGSAISTATWYHVVVTMSSSNAYQMYVNAGTAVTGSGAGGGADSALEFRIGAYGATPTGYFNGMIDEVTLTSDFITSGVVTTIYNSGNGIEYETAGGGSVNSNFFAFM
jgi:hypothetical protein